MTGPNSDRSGRAEVTLREHRNFGLALHLVAHKPDAVIVLLRILTLLPPARGRARHFFHLFSLWVAACSGLWHVRPLHAAHCRGAAFQARSHRLYNRTAATISRMAITAARPRISPNLR